MMRLFIKLMLIVAIGMFIFPVVPAFAQDSKSGSSDGSSGRSGRSSRSSRDSGSSDRGETVNDRDRRREDRSKQREDNSRSRRSSRGRGSDDDDKDKEKEKEKSKDSDKKDTKTVKGKKSSSSGKGSSSGGGRPTVDIKFEMQVDPETNIMYLESVADRPSLNVNVLENKKFVTRLALYNPKSSLFSQLDVSIKYDPQLIQPIGVDDSMISSNLEKPARILVNNDQGLLSMAADFKEPRNDSFVTIAKIQWKALNPVASTPISFINTHEHPSGVFNDSGENILHMRSDGTVEMSRNAGLLDATVSVEPANGSIELAKSSGNPFSAVALATNINAGTAEGGIRLHLRPRDTSVRVGETFLVDVIYQNPRRADMDTVKLQIRYDPNVLQVVDTDEGNWITRDVNIFDGAYHGDLPFDYHRKNDVYNNLGLIVYEMGFGTRAAVPGQGIIATIKFNAIAPAVNTPIAFSVGEDPALEPDTAISFLGFNLIGKPGQRKDSIGNTSVSVGAPQDLAAGYPGGE